MEATRTQNRSQQTATFVMRSGKNAQQSITLSWSKLFAWQQDNPFITSGYRPASNSYKESVASIWYIHNQSVNIWTHLIGAVGATFSAVVFYGSIQSRFDMATMEDVVMFLCFFLGAAGCLGMSATYHAISIHSEEVAALGNQLDCKFLFVHTHKKI
jgi:adiponectin receptor